MTPTVLPLSDVHVPEHRHRQLDWAAVDRLAASIREVGLLNPITVTPDGTLVSGLHRCQACASIGWEVIPATVVDLDEVRAELAELDENLVRNELTALERGEHLARRKELYEALHPETKHGGARGNQHTGGKIRSPDLAKSAAAFVDDTHAKTGRSRTVVAEEVKLANDLAPELRDAVRNTPLADNKRALAALADEDEDRQRELAEEGPEAIEAAAKAKTAKRGPRLSAEERARLLAMADPTHDAPVDRRDIFVQQCRAMVTLACPATEVRALLEQALACFDAPEDQVIRLRSEIDSWIVEVRERGEVLR